MTSLDEALRALENVAEEMRARRVNHGKSESPTLVAWASRIDEAIALLSDRQEVAPVAIARYRWEPGVDATYKYATPVPDEGGDWCRYTSVCQAMFFAKLATSTGQTSDARDVVLESELEKSSGRACDFTWDAPVVLLDTAIALMRAPVVNARDCPARFFASGPDAFFFTDSAQFAEDTILAHDYDRDDWTITDLYAAMQEAGK